MDTDGAPTDTKHGAPRVPLWKRLMPVAAFLCVLFAVAEFSGLREHLDLGMLRMLLLQHPVGGVALFVGLFCLGNLAQIPGWLFLAAAVLALGRVGGGLATYMAACVSCMVTFYSVRWLGGDALRQLDGRLARQLLARLDAAPVASMIALRTLFQTAPALNYTLALSGVASRDYLLATLAGLPLPILLYCLFFDYLAMALGIA
ncbi:MAG: VTT domain-containing protein [Rhodocyclaceae bacterium]|nr:VTT domain-containing protein [Rhodocyclaceae bacterium]